MKVISEEILELDSLDQVKYSIFLLHGIKPISPEDEKYAILEGLNGQPNL
jgi:hypothetical protein